MAFKHCHRKESWANMAKACLQNVLSSWIPIMTRFIFLFGFSKPCTMVQLDNWIPPVVRLSCQSNHQTIRSPTKYSKEYFLWLNVVVASPTTLLLEPKLCLHFLWMLCGTSEHMLSFEPFDTITPLSKSCLPLGRMVPFFHVLTSSAVVCNSYWDPRVRVLCVCWSVWWQDFLRR